MAITFDLAKDAPADTELRIVGTTTEDATGLTDPAVRVAGFEGKAGQTVLLADRLLVGLGAAAAVNDATVRRAAGVAARAARRVERVAVEFPVAHARALAEGFTLGAYGFAEYRSEPKPNRLASVTLVGAGGAPVRKALAQGARLGEATIVARDLVNEPGGSLTPSEFAKRTVAIADAAGVSAEVLDEKAIRKAGLEGLLAVNKGSAQPARFVTLTYEPEGKARATVALVGKGITFDSGGLSLKTAEGMTTMKCDMGGAAAVVGAMSVLRDLNVKVRVVAYLPMTDNMTGGDAQRVGDVIRYRNGRTVEVLNTDAEGRLVLADALCLATEAKPDAIVDLATLTGACMVALGGKVAGLFTASDDLAAQLDVASATEGEALWRLPLVDAYRRDIDSKVADIKNTGGRTGGAITAALFLREFVGEGIAWAHLDIAGPAFGDDDGGVLSAGASGFGVRTIARFLTDFRKIAPTPKPS